IYFTILTVCCCIKFTYPALFFPSNSAYGVFAAIAVPLDLPHRNVFVSYNFEANYNLPENWDLPPYAVGVEEEDLFEDVGRLNNGVECKNCTSSSSSSRKVEGDTDATIEDEIVDEDENENVDETEETTTTAPGRNETDSSRKRKRRRRRREIPSLLTRTHFYHILIDKFERPTTSKNENLPLIYYQAELDGIHDQCHHYEQECSESILDLISSPIHQIIDELQRNTNRY
ncbi:hypothetical protein DOY81_010822, partial [Sarcophaga bullata]